MKEKFNIYQEITDRIIDKLEQGEIPWQKPWVGGAQSGAFNRISKKPYSLLNQLLLQHDGEYATYKQWESLGGQVRKGEHAEIVVFWKPTQVTETDEDGHTLTKTVPILRYFSVFHISQVDGVAPLASKEKTFDHQPIDKAEMIKCKYMSREHLRIIETSSDRAFYSPSQDYIQIPGKEQYEDINEFYSTLFHEMVHSTGHATRLNRFEKQSKAAAFGSAEYSKEELIAEIGAAALVNMVGIETTNTFNNSVAYVQSWLKVLRNDNKFIVSASSRAEKAVKYILGV